MTPPRLGLVTPALALFGLLVASDASAHEIGPAPPSEPSAVRYQRSAPKIEARNEMRAKFLDAQRKAEAAKAEQRAAELEDMRERERMIERERITQAITDEKIAKLKELVRQTEQDSPELPDLLMRLADLHLEKKAHFELQAGALHEQIHEAEHGAEPTATKPAATKASPPTPEATRRPKGRKHRRR
jgi:hypothetical protein